MQYFHHSLHKKSACAVLAQADSKIKELAFLDCFGGAVIAASAAAYAGVSIDDVLVFAFGNSLDGALVSAGTAADASIGNLVSHDIPSICVV